MGPESGRDVSRYDSEDTRPTSEKELRGFYTYGWASEVFVVCGMGSFIPITLEQLARERGVWSVDRSTPCTTALDPAASARASATGPVEPPQCILPIFGTEINTASFAMYTFSISVFLQSLLIISMSGAADHGRYRKQLLLIFGFTGAGATMLFLPLSPNVLLLASLMAIISNTCYGASSVLLNSFLPVLVRNHPDVNEYSKADQRQSRYMEHEIGSADREDEPFLERSESRTDFPLLRRSFSTNADLPGTAADLLISTKISSYGIGIGYIAALLVQASAIAIVKAMHSTLFSLQAVLFLVGFWWFVFTIPSAFWLRPRPGPPLDLPASTGRARMALAYATYSWKSLGRSIMRARGLRDVLLFLAAWLLLSDAVATVSGTAVLFAKTTLQMQPAALALINVIATLSGIVGAFSWRKVSQLAGLQPTQTVLACIVLFELVPLYGLLGYVPMVKRWGVGGLQQGWEMYPLATIYGLVLGGLSSFCRSLFAQLIPPGFEAAFYSLYAITDKGSSVFGPLVVGAITDATGHIRPAFFFLAVLIAAPLPILLCVDVERGAREGRQLARELGVGLAAAAAAATADTEDADEHGAAVDAGEEAARQDV